MKAVSIITMVALTVLLLSFELGGMGRPVISPEDSLELDRMKWMKEVMNSIKGKEKLPAHSVFKTLKS